MANYILPAGFNFESALGSLDDESAGDDMCLISHERLRSPYITLSCGHRFNYCPLYFEVQEQKKTRVEGGNTLETTRLLPHQMKCPYCRHIEGHTLPFFPGQGVPKTRNVNIPRKWGLLPNNCSCIMKGGKRKGMQCGRPSHGDLCEIHLAPAGERPLSDTCQILLVRGPRKGMKCGARAESCVVEGTTCLLCRRHAKIKGKSA